MKRTKNIAILISGKGTNALKIMQYFHLNPKIKVSLIISNKQNQWIESQCKKHKAEYLHLENIKLLDSEYLKHLISNKNLDLIVLAGYLKKIPADFIRFFPNKIINIHPALLPKYGGKGMYGNHVHSAVLKCKEIESGITIHYVNEEFDKGEIIAQFSCSLDNNENMDTLKEKIQQLEHHNFPKVIEQLLNNS